MKTLRIVLGVFLISSSLVTAASFTLNEGESVVFRFNHLRIYQRYDPAGIIPEPYASFGVTVTSLTGGDEFKLEAFEDNLADAPWCSATGYVQDPIPSEWNCAATGPFWQDLQGWARITMLRESAHFDHPSADVQLGRPPYHNYARELRPAHRKLPQKK